MRESAIGGGRRLGAERQRDADGGSPVATALDAAGAAEEPRALAHASKSQAASAGGLVETDPVVAHVEMEPALAPRQLDLDAGAVGVAGGVEEALLQDAEGRRLDGRGHPHLPQVVDEAYPPACLLRGVLEGATHGVGEPERVHRRRPEPAQDAARLHDGALEPLGGAAELVTGTSGVPIFELPARVDVLLGAHDELGKAVVHVEGDAPS